MRRHSPLPGNGPGAVTACTVGGIPGLLMIGILRGIVIVHMTIGAIGWSSCINTVFMTIGAGGGLMFSF